MKDDAVNPNVIGAREDLIGAKEHLVGAKEHIIPAKEELVGAKEHLVGAKDELIAAKQQAVGDLPPGSRDPAATDVYGNNRDVNIEGNYRGTDIQDNPRKDAQGNVDVRIPPTGSSFIGSGIIGAAGDPPVGTRTSQGNILKPTAEAGPTGTDVQGKAAPEDVYGNYNPNTAAGLVGNAMIGRHKSEPEEKEELTPEQQMAEFQKQLQSQLDAAVPKLSATNKIYVIMKEAVIGALAGFGFGQVGGKAYAKRKHKDFDPKAPRNTFVPAIGGAVLGALRGISSLDREHRSKVTLATQEAVLQNVGEQANMLEQAAMGIASQRDQMAEEYQKLGNQAVGAIKQRDEVIENLQQENRQLHAVTSQFVQSIKAQQEAAMVSNKDEAPEAEKETERKSPLAAIVEGGPKLPVGEAAAAVEASIANAAGAVPSV